MTYKKWEIINVKDCTYYYLNYKMLIIFDNTVLNNKSFKDISFYYAAYKTSSL